MIFSSLGITGVPTSITITHPAATDRVAVCQRNHSGSPLVPFIAGVQNQLLDAGSTPAAPNSSPTVGPLTPNPPFPTELLIVGVIGTRRAPALTPGIGCVPPTCTGYTEYGSVSTGGTAANVTNHMGHQNVLVVPPGQDFYRDGSLAASTTWNAVMAIYRFDHDAAAELTDFSGDRVAGSARLAWTTESEHNIAGYRVLREDALGKMYNLTPAILPAMGGALSGYTYTFEDTSAPASGALYWLEDVDVMGRAQRHGPVRVMPARDLTGVDALLELEVVR
jgi:hypothetical protein